MKKKILMAGALVLLTGAVLGPQEESKAYEDKGFQYEVQDNEARLQGLVDSTEAEKGGTLDIPSELGGFKVTTIEGSAFYNAKYTEVNIPDTVTYISANAFGNNRKLKKVKLSKNLKEINYLVFQNCESLENITIPDGVESVASSAFSECISLKEIKIPDSVKTIGDRAFSSCYKLSKVEFGNQLQKIDDMAFYKSYALESITIPATVQEIGYSAFEGCTGLKNVVFENPNTKLGNAVFSKCKSLTKAVLPGKIKTIPERTFYYCKKTKQVQLPESVRVIKSEAFKYCDSLKSVKLSKNVYAIGDTVFADSGLKKIILNRKLQFIGNGAFRRTSIRTIRIYDKVSYIGNRLFEGCEKLKKIKIPATVKGINPGAFVSCTSLQEINVDANNKKYCSQDGVLYNKNKTKLIQYPLNKRQKSFVAPRSVKKIRARAFYGNKYLENVTVYADTIGKYAFAEMDKLTKVTLGYGARIIKDSAFSTNSSLKEVVLPDSLETIGSNAFAFSAINRINIPRNLNKLESGAFYRCNKLQAFEGGFGRYYKVQDGVLYNKDKTALIKYPARKADKTFVIPNGVSIIRKEAFDHVKGLKNLEIGRSFRCLKYRAISECPNLKSITFNCEKNRNYKSSLSGVYKCEQLAVIIGPFDYNLRSIAYIAGATYITM